MELGLPLFVMECAERHGGALRSALAAGYPAVDVIPMEEFPGAAAGSPPGQPAPGCRV